MLTQSGDSNQSKIIWRVYKLNEYRITHIVYFSGYTYFTAYKKIPCFSLLLLSLKMSDLGIPMRSIELSRAYSAQFLINYST